jgi:hypothetical protein
MSLLSSLTGSSAVMGTVAQTVSNDPTFLLNRERLAAMVAMGYGYLDWYAAYRSTFFAISLVATAASVAGIIKRKANPEAKTLYTILALTSLGVAYFTRPDMLRAAPPPIDPSAPPTSTAMPALLGFLDNKGAELSASEPGWEAQNLLRLANDFGSGTIDPSVQTLLASNSH